MALAAVIGITGCGPASPELVAYREGFASALSSYLNTPAERCVEEPTPVSASYPWSNPYIEELDVHLTGRLLILDNDNDLGARGGHDRNDDLRVSEDNLWLGDNAPDLFAAGPEQVGAVAKVVLLDEKVGTYTDGASAMETDAYVTLIDRRTGCSWPELRISGGMRPGTKSGGGDAWGDLPDVLDRLVALPREP